PPGDLMMGRHVGMNRILTPFAALRQIYPELGAHALGADKVQLGMHHFYQLLSNNQAYARTFHAAVFGIKSVKRLEHFTLTLRRNALTVIAYAKSNFSAGRDG